MSPSHRRFLFAIVLLIALPDTALAYIGPGAGLGAIAVAIALLLGVLLLVVGLVWYPLKRLLRRQAKGASNTSDTDGSR